ncbi:hypothetical protein LJR290_006166 [Variovorax sp. LjRoot290]
MRRLAERPMLEKRVVLSVEMRRFKCPSAARRGGDGARRSRRARWRRPWQPSIRRPASPRRRRGSPRYSAELLAQ